MTPENVFALVRHQRARGPLPSSVEGLAALVRSLRELPTVRIDLTSQLRGALEAHSAILRLRALGLTAEEDDEGQAAVRFPADGDALDRVLELLELPPLASGGAAAVLAALEAGSAGTAGKPPPFSFPLRVQSAKASALGWSSELFSLTVLVSNVALREEDGALLPTGRGPVVAVCAEYDRPLTSLDPPDVAPYAMDRARAEGMPMLRLNGGLLRRKLHLEATNTSARSSVLRPQAMARAEKFLSELDEAWQQRIGPTLKVAWPVYRPEKSGPLLDGVRGAPLPAMQLR